MNKYVTRKLTAGDVIEKEGSIMYVISSNKTFQQKLDGNIEVDVYTLASSRGVTQTFSGSTGSMDGRGWVVTHVLTEDGYDKACRNPASVTPADYLELEWKFIYDSSLGDKVEKIQTVMQEHCDNGAMFEDVAQQLLEILCS